MSPEPQRKAPLFDLVLNRTGLLLIFGAFGATLGFAIAVILSRTGPVDLGAAVGVGLTATLALAAIAEIGLSVQSSLERHFPESKPQP